MPTYYFKGYGGSRAVHLDGAYDSKIVYIPKECANGVWRIEIDEFYASGTRSYDSIGPESISRIITDFVGRHPELRVTAIFEKYDQLILITELRREDGKEV